MLKLLVAMKTEPLITQQLAFCVFYFRLVVARIGQYWWKQWSSDEPFVVCIKAAQL